MNDTIFEQAIDKFDRNMAEIDERIKRDGLNDALQHLVDENVSSLSKKCSEFEKSLLNTGPKELLAPFTEAFRKKTHKWFMKSPCIRRSFEKPQGYAGDFAIIDRIYRNRPEGEGMGLALDKYFLENKGSQAMRSRKMYIVENISTIIRSHPGGKTNFSIFDLGCGPSRDVSEIFETTGPVKTILMDQDKDALNYSKDLLKPYLDHIEFIQHNLLRIIAGEKYVAKKFGLHDIVMCIGLYDYLDEDAFARLLRSSLNLLKGNGTLVLSNWNVTNPSRTELEWVCDWYLYHRTEQEMMRIFEKAGIPSTNVSLAQDPTGHFHIAFIKNHERTKDITGIKDKGP